MNWETVMQELSEADIIRFEKELGDKWQNRNDRHSEEHPPTRKRDWSEYVIWVSTLGIIAVCAALIYSEYL
jgi:hypothetical protein